MDMAYSARNKKNFKLFSGKDSGFDIDSKVKINIEYSFEQLIKCKTQDLQSKSNPKKNNQCSNRSNPSNVTNEDLNSTDGVTNISKQIILDILPTIGQAIAIAM